MSDTVSLNITEEFKFLKHPSSNLNFNNYPSFLYYAINSGIGDEIRSLIANEARNLLNTGSISNYRTIDHTYVEIKRKQVGDDIFVYEYFVKITFHRDGFPRDKITKTISGIYICDIEKQIHYVLKYKNKARLTDIDFSTFLLNVKQYLTPLSHTSNSSETESRIQISLTVNTNILWNVLSKILLSNMCLRNCSLNDLQSYFTS